MGRVYNKDKVEDFPIEIFLDTQKTLKVVIERDENNKYPYKIFVNGIKEDSSIIETLEQFTDGKYNEKDNAIIGELVKNKFKPQLLEMKIKNFRKIQLDTKENLISYPVVPALMRTMMAQTDKPQMPEIVDMEWENDPTTDLHCHYTAMLEPEKLLALGLKHNVNYPISYIYALGLELSDKQKELIENKILEKSGEQVLQNIKDNIGNWNKIKDIFKNKNNKEIAQISIPLSALLIGKSEMKEKNFNKIIESCSLSKEAQNSFTDMKDTYTKRLPFTNGREKSLSNQEYQRIIESKNISKDVKKIFQEMCLDRYNPAFKDNNLQEDMMLWIARNAKEIGIDYVEMSHNALATTKNEENIQSYNKVLDNIEKETETKLRFLAGISRSTKKEKANEILANVKKSLQSKYVTGIDFLGEESNSTKDFEEMLSNLTEYAIENDPDMVIRVHAGETASYDSNVMKTLQIVYGKYLDKLRENKSQGISTNIPKPNLRIGHGIYGLTQELEKIDPKSPLGDLISELAKFGMFDLESKPINQMNLLDIMAEMDTVIERCITSNVLLSNKNDLSKDPMQTYIDHGVKCVLATDGGGVYGTNLRDETIIATTVGIDEYYIEEILKAEEYVKARSLNREQYIERSEKNITKGINYTEQDGNNTNDTVKNLIITDFPNNEKIPIIIAGGSFNKFDIDENYVESELQEKDLEILNYLINNLDSEKYFFVIGGRMEGQEGKILELLEQKNDKMFDVVMVTKEANNLSEENQSKAIRNNLKIIESGEKEEFESYKKIDRDIFSQDRKSFLLVFDGYQETEYLVADANNGRNNHIVYARENINELLNFQRNNIKNKKTIQDVTSLGKEILGELEDTNGKFEIQEIMQERENMLKQKEEKNQGVEIG